MTALCLSLITGLLLVLATRHPPVQQVLKGGVQKAGELLQGVRTPAFEVNAGLLCHASGPVTDDPSDAHAFMLGHQSHNLECAHFVLHGSYLQIDGTNMHDTILIAESALPGLGQHLHSVTGQHAFGQVPVSVNAMNTFVSMCRLLPPHHSIASFRALDHVANLVFQDDSLSLHREITSHQTPSLHTLTFNKRGPVLPGVHAPALCTLDYTVVALFCCGFCHS